MGFNVSSLEIYAVSLARLHWRASHMHVRATNLHLGVGPAWHLDDHVQNGLLLIGIQRNVVERRERHAILLDVDAVLEGIWSADFPGGVLRRSLGAVALLLDG